jgi:hypothetical protein
MGMYRLEVYERVVIEETELRGLFQDTQVIPLYNRRCFDNLSVQSCMNSRVKFVIVAPARLVDVGSKHKGRLCDLGMWDPLRFIQPVLLIDWWCSPRHSARQMR